MTQLQLPETPELDKMAKVSDESQIIGDFLDTIFSRGMVLAEWDSVSGGYQDERLFAIHKSIEQILADYYEIDLNKVETERRALLAALH